MMNQPVPSLSEEERKVFEAHFLSAVLDRIGKDEFREVHWPPLVKQATGLYVQSLIYGNADTPSGLPANYRNLIQFDFAVTCLRLNLPRHALPGQFCKWYRRLAHEARGWLQNHQ